MLNHTVAIGLTRLGGYVAHVHFHGSAVGLDSTRYIAHQQGGHNAGVQRAGTEHYQVGIEYF